MNEERKAEAFDIVQRPKHYNLHPSGIETIEICELLSFSLGNALKYVWRSGDKDDRKQDLKKAVWYLNRFYNDVRYNPGVDNYRLVAKLSEQVLAVEGKESCLGYFLKTMITDPDSNWPMKIVARLELEISRLEAERTKDRDPHGPREGDLDYG